MGLETANPPDAATRAQALLAPVLPRRRGPAEADLSAVAAPDETAVFFCRTGARDDTSWLSDFEPIAADGAPGGANNAAETYSPATASSATGISHIDHIALTQPYDRFDEATLFYRTVLGLQTQHSSEIAAPFGLVRNRAVANPDGTVRVCLSVSVLRRGTQWQPGVTDPQHVAFGTDDIFAAVRAARAAGAMIVEVPANYYDDLDARLALPSAQLNELRELNVLLDRSAERGVPALLHRGPGRPGVLRGGPADGRLPGLRGNELARPDGRPPSSAGRSGCGSRLAVRLNSHSFVVSRSVADWLRGRRSVIAG